MSPGRGIRPRLPDGVASAPSSGGPMFSTLLGVLPTVTAEGAAVTPSRDGTTDQDARSAADGDVQFVLGELAGTGLELLATGLFRPPIDLPASDVVRVWQSASAATDRPVKQVLRGPYSEGRDGPR